MALPFPTHTDCKFCLLITGVKNSSSTIYFYLGPLSQNLYIDVLSSSPYANSHNLMPAPRSPIHAALSVHHPGVKMAVLCSLLSTFIAYSFCVLSPSQINKDKRLHMKS